MSIHLVLLTLSCCALAAAAAGGQLAGLTEDSLRARQMALLVSGALVAGNAACLLPVTPGWYSAGLVALTFAGLVWLAVSTVAARSQRRRNVRTTVAPGVTVAARPTVITGVATTTAQTRSAARTDRPHFAVLPATAVGGGTIAAPATLPAALATVPAASPTLSDQASYPVVQATPLDSPAEGVQWDAGLLAAYLSERTLVTRADLDTIGSRGARAQNVGIARRIGSYAPEAAKRRAAGSAFRQRAHALDGSVLRAQLRSAYDDAPAPQRSPGAQA